MHDPRFEKEVQQKMEGLEFTPPEAVWLKVERAVNQTRRRRLPVFWLFFFAGIILLGSGGIFLATRRNGPAALTNTNTNAGNRLSGANHSLAVNPAAGSDDKGNPVAVQESTVKKSTVQESTAPDSTAKEGVGKADGASENSRTDAGSTYLNARPNSMPSRAGGSSSTSSIRQISTTNHKRGFPDKNTAFTADNYRGSNDNNPVSANRMTSGKVATGALTPILTGTRGDIAASYRKILSSPSGMKGVDKKSVQKLQVKHKHAWEGGFAGGVGTSSMNQNLFRTTTINALDLRQNAGTPVTSYGALPPPKVSTSRIQPDISFWAGIMAQKQLSGRFTLVTGLNLHYYSTRLRTGDQVGTGQPNPATANSYFNATSLAAAPAPSAPYYPVGSEQVYINKYYFLELPVSVQWRINNSRLLPLFWEGGLSVSYLMSSDGLYYNTTDGVYYKDGAVANRTQLNATTSVMIGLPVKGIRIQAGPQLQYGLTRILSEGTAGDGHMFFAGLKLVVLPGKAK